MGFILEHATAYVFRQHTKARVDNDMKTNDRYNIPRDQKAIEKNLAADHIRRVSSYDEKGVVVFYCSVCLQYLHGYQAAINHAKDKIHKSVKRQLAELDSL